MTKSLHLSRHAFGQTRILLPGNAWVYACIMDVARRYPLFAKFVARAGVNVRPGSLRHEYMSPSIKAAIKAGDFADMPLVVALDFIAGNILTAVVRISEGELDDNYLTGLIAATFAWPWRFRKEGGLPHGHPSVSSCTWTRNALPA